MNKHIADYTHEMLVDFYYFLVLYEGRLGVKDVRDISIRACEDDGEYRELQAHEALTIIEKFIEHQKEVVYPC